MIYIQHYNSYVGGITISSDGNALTGLWFDGQKYYAGNIDDEIEEKYFANEPDEVTDGDKFLEYEGLGVEYTLLVDDDNSPIEVVAKDRDGNVIPDYPMPSNVEQLQFNINMTTQSAEDELHRKYRVEKV